MTPEVSHTGSPPMRPASTRTIRPHRPGHQDMTWHLRTQNQTGDWRGWRGWGWHRGWDDGSPQWKSWEDKTEQTTWEDLETVLPEEVLGWLLLRRSNLSSGSKLSIQAAAGNSLKFNDIERAMRQQEDELLHNEKHWSAASWKVLLGRA